MTDADTDRASDTVSDRPPAPAVTAADFPTGRWRARWIWSRRAPVSLTAASEPVIDHDAARSVTLLRRMFELETVPRCVVARATADSRYVLFVNGAEVGRGPVRGHPQHLHYDLYDLAPHLHTGRNVVAVLARHYGRTTPWWMPSSPTFGLGAGSFLFEAALGDAHAPATPWISTDEAWRVLEPGAWTELAGTGIGATPPEVLDARALPAGWQQLDFDDATWRAATALPANHVGYSGDPHPPTHPYGPLLPRPIPQLTGALRTAHVVATATAAADASAGATDDPVERYGADERDAELVERDAPTPRWTFEAAPEDVTVVVLDFGEQVAGHVGLTVDAPAGTTIAAKAAEALGAGSRLEALQQHSGFGYTCRGHDDTFETFDKIGLRYLGLAIRGEGPVTIREVTVREANFPRRTVTSAPSSIDRSAIPHFTCSDPLLDDIWRIGRRTVDLCSQDAYLDCPSREQRAWTGDAVVHQLVDLTTNTDWSLARWNVELGGSPRPDGMLPMVAGGDFEAYGTSMIPDWALHWVHAMKNLWDYTGDRELLLGLLPVAERVLRWFLPFQDRDGLLDNVTGWVIIDWSAVVTSGKSAALNALWARALWDFARVCEALGDEARHQWAHRTWTRVHDGFEQFWDAGRGVYVDNIDRGIPGRTVSQHSNAAAIVGGLVDDAARARSIVDAITDRDRIEHAAWLVPGTRATLAGAGDMYAGTSYLFTGPAEPWWDVESTIVAAQPFFRYVVHDAVAHVGDADRIPALCRDWEVLMQRSATTWTEVWYGGSHCHGWCSTPTRDLVQRTLGVLPGEPGFTRARIEPRLGDLRWAAGAVPTPSGLLHLRVDGAALTIDSPIPFDLHASGRVSAHDAGQHELRLDGGQKVS